MSNAIHNVMNKCITVKGSGKISSDPREFGNNDIDVEMPFGIKGPVARLVARGAYLDDQEPDSADVTQLEIPGWSTVVSFTVLESDEDATYSRASHDYPGDVPNAEITSIKIVALDRVVLDPEASQQLSDSELAQVVIKKYNPIYDQEFHDRVMNDINSSRYKHRFH